MRSLLAVALALAAFLVVPAFAQAPDPDAAAPAASPAANRTAKPLPPPGIAIPEADRAELATAVSAFGHEIAALRGSPATFRPDLLPDVEIFHKAVDWALRHDEFHDRKELAVARELLAEGRARAAALREGRAPWTSKTGLVVRGFRSALDGSVQPFGMVVPETWQGTGDELPRATWVWNHGRGDTLSELAFLAQRRRNAGDFAPTNTFVLHPYGRFCNATKFAGEIDVFEALAAARRAYPVDPRRLVNAGFSMGGASAWHLAVHHPDFWAASHPGAGFAETAEYAGALAPGRTPPPWWEQVLWRWYDATVAVANLRRHPVLAYHGSDDKQGQATAIMKRFAALEDVDIRHFIGPATGHKYEPETRRRIAAEIDGILRDVPPLDAAPREVRFVTHSLVYPRADWITVTGLERHWERAEITGRVLPPADGANPRLHLATRGISRLRLDPPPRIGTQPPPARYAVVIDDQTLPPIPVVPTTFARTAGRWALEVAPAPGAPTPLRKAPGLCGPIDHAFLSAFLFVQPTGQPLSPELDAWTRRELAHAVRQWRALFRGDAPVRADVDVSPDDIASRHLVLWGDPQSNAVLRRLADRLPVKWTAAGVEFGGRTYAPGHVPILIFPNPLDPRRYVVLNSGFTFSRAIGTGTNSQQTPKLPDWAIVDIHAPPDDRFPGRVVDAGFFDEEWQFTSVRPR